MNQSQNVVDANDPTFGVKVMLQGRTLTVKIRCILVNRDQNRLKSSLFLVHQGEPNLLMHCLMASDDHLHRTGLLDLDVASFEMACMTNLRLAEPCLSICSPN
jgi:hypothetical protein